MSDPSRQQVMDPGCGTPALGCAESPAEGVQSTQPRAAGPRVRPRPANGVPLVLTADRTLFAAYHLLLEGMIAASQTTRTPSPLMSRLLAPPLAHDGVHASRAPLGLRRIQAALMDAGRPADDIAVTSPGQLKRVVGPDTRLIGISSGDPLGYGMNSTTMEGLAGGTIYTSHWFRRLAARIGRLRRRAPEAKLVLGGPGAWQLAQDHDARRALGIDHLITGYCEGNVAELFKSILDGDACGPVLVGRNPTAEDIPPIAGPTVMGSVEISRGCGLGCHFCTIGREPMLHLPTDTILADAETNMAAGVRNIALITEDAFRYGAHGTRLDPHALIDLLHRLRSIPDLGLIQTDHTNVLSVEQMADAELAEVRRLMLGDAHPRGLVWLNLGVETASGDLLAANGGRPKMGPNDPDAWGDLCLEQVRRLTRLGYFPLVSLVLGFPGETEDHINKTLRWVQDLRDARAAVFPVFHAPIAPAQHRFGISDMTRAHWRLFRTCYRLNFKWMPHLFWDNQTGGAVSTPRRLLIQALGYGQIWWWRSLFVWRSGRLFA